MTTEARQITTETEPVATETETRRARRRRGPRRRDRPKRLRRTTGAMSGVLIVILGLWGGLIPFVGPYFHYAYGSYATWHYTHQRLWLDILPGAAAVVGGLMLLRGTSRAGGLFAGALALVAGAWFAIGPTVSLLWHSSGDPIGAPMGGHIRQMLEQLGFFYALGVSIAALAAFAMGRFASRPPLAAEPSVSRAMTPPVRPETDSGVPDRAM